MSGTGSGTGGTLAEQIAEHIESPNLGLGTAEQIIFLFRVGKK